MSKIRIPFLPLARSANGPQFRAPESATERWDKTVQAKAAAKNEFTIEVLDFIGNFFGEGVSAIKIKEKLKEAGKRPVTVQINSPGGDMFEGVAIYNLLRDHAAGVNVRVIGMAASAASIIAMAGDNIAMDESSFMMIHNSWGMAMGDANELNDFADLLSRYDETMANLYAARTGNDAKAVKKMMDKETWLSAQEALDLNFANEVIPNEKGGEARARAVVSLKGDRFSPAAVRAALGSMNGAGARVALASARSAPGASGKVVFSTLKQQGTEMKTVEQQISAFEAKRAASIARMAEIMNLAGEEGRSLTPAEAEEHDNLKGEVEQVDAHLVRLREHAKLVASTAVAVAGNDPNSASQSRGGNQPANPNNPGGIPGAYGTGIRVQNNAPKGTGFTRYVIALSAAKGNKHEAAMIAKSRWPDMPEVNRALMAAVDPGTTTDSAWAAPLVVQENLASEFIDLLRPATIVGRVQGFRNVPFNVKMPRQTSGSTVGWVGQGLPKPVSELAFDSVSLGWAKISGIVVLTEELVRFSSPAAEGLVRSDLISTISQFMDQQFIDPSVAAVANISPASVLNGVSAIPSTGATVALVTADVQSLMQTFVAANISLLGGVWVMNPRTALALSMLRTTQDIYAFPNITVNGGTFFGLPVITSNNVPIAGTSGNPTIIALLAPGEILFADDGGVTIDVSREASLQMDSAPSSGAQSQVSLWQNNLVGLRAERYINYLKRRSAAAGYISGVTY